MILKNDKICLVSTVKSPIEQLKSFVNYHLNIGIDHIFLFFDNPKDIAIEFFEKNNKISCFKCDSKHWKKIKSQKDLMKKVTLKYNKEGYLCLDERQQLNANFAFELAKKEKYYWVIHLDSDELLYSKKPIKKILSKYKNFDVLRILAIEAVPEKLSYDNTLKKISLFKNFGVISRYYYRHKKLLQKLAPNLKKNEGKTKLRTMYFSGAAAGKSIISTSSKINNIGIHEPSVKDNYKLKYAFPKKINILHFECKSFDDWKNKWTKVFDNPKDTIGYKKGVNSFYDEFAIAHKNKDYKKMEELYKKNYFISKTKKRILMFFGLLKRIRLNRKLFK
jgi:hypothetical protein